MENNSLTDIVKSRRESGEGIASSLGGALKEKVKENLDWKRALPQGGLLTTLFPKLTAYKAQKANSPTSKVVKLISSNLASVAKSSVKIKSIAKNISGMKTEVNKFAKLETVTPVTMPEAESGSETTPSFMSKAVDFVKSNSTAIMIGLAIAGVGVALTLGLDKIKSTITEAFDSFANFGLDVFDKLSGSITGAFDGIRKSGGEIYDNMKESITSVYAGLKDFGNIAYDKMEESVNSISNNITKAKDGVLSLVNGTKAEESVTTPPTVPETEPPKTEPPKTEPPKRPPTASERRAANRQANNASVKGIEGDSTSTKPEIFNPNNESSSTSATDTSEPSVEGDTDTSPFRENININQTGGGAVTSIQKPMSTPTPGSLRDRATSQPFEGSQKQFYDKMYATLLSEATKQGVQNPEAIARVGTAQSVIETGYGKSLAGGNNYFGIKARPGEGGPALQTQEFINGKMVTINDKFRRYNNMEESAADYVKFLKENSRYKETLAAKTVDEAILAIGRSGYATDPGYANKLKSVNGSGMAGNLPNAAAKPTQNASTSPNKIENASTDFPTWSKSMQNHGEMKKIDGAVIHHTGGGSMSGAIETLKQRGLSYHYIIDKDGTVKQLIPGKGIGYHAESYNVNTFGIALVAEDDSKVTAAQISASISLNARLASTYNYDPKSVFGHGEISKNKMPSEGKAVVDSIRSGLTPTVTGAVKDVPGVPAAGLKPQQRQAAAAPQQSYAPQQNNNQNTPQTAAVYNRNVAQILLGSLINSSGYG
jgi:flagellum-specific peptidoglycan hydrolase FlgJ